MAPRRLLALAMEDESAAACVEFLLGYYAGGEKIGPKAWRDTQRDWDETFEAFLASGEAADVRQAELRALRFLVRSAGTEAVFAWM